jgi:resolvase-like protein
MAALIAYLRSPRDRNGQRLGLEEQREAVRAWARQKRHRVVGVIEDDSPATKPEQRPGLLEAVAALRDGLVDGLVLTSLDSLAEDLVVQEQLLAELRLLGARVYSLSPADTVELRSIPSDPSRQVVRRVLRATVDNAHSMRAVRSARSRNAAGSPPYGYRIDNGDLVPEPAEQGALARIAELGAAGATLREMARTLDAEGHRAKRADRWHPESLRRILKRLQT